MPVTFGIVEADWTITRSTGVIDYIGERHNQANPSYATVIQLHRFLQDKADDPAFSGDDELDITDATPSDRSTDNIITLINGFTITERAAEHLYDGSIIQSGGDVIYDAIVNFGNAKLVQVAQNGALLANQAEGQGAIPFWNNDPQGNGFGLNSDPAAGISHRFLVKVRDAGADIDLRKLLGKTRRFNFTYGEFPINATNRGNNVFALSEAADLNNQTAEATVATYDQFSNTEGLNLIDVNNDATDEEYYSQWTIGGGTTPANPVINDLYEYTKWLTRDGSVSTLYGLNGELFRGVTHQIEVQSGTQSATDFLATEPVSWTGGTGRMLAIDDVNAADTMWIQLLTGTVPGDGVVITGGTSGATITTAVSNAVTARTVSTPFIGVSTGSAVIGAYGVGIDRNDLSASDLLRALDDVTYQPPNNVTFNVNGVQHDEDYVLVTDASGSGTNINLNQFVLQSSLTTDNITTVVVGSGLGTPDETTIDTDTPTPSGTIRVQDDNGDYRKIAYTAAPGATQFNGCQDPSDATGQTDFLTVNATAPRNVYLSYLDELTQGQIVSAGSFVTGVEYQINTVGTTDFTLIGAADNNPGTRFVATGAGTGTGDAYIVVNTLSFTVVYRGTPRDLFIRVRDGGTAGDNEGIKTFETTGVLGDAGGATTVIRTTDA